MIPKSSNLTGFQIREHSSKTFRLDIPTKSSIGYVDEIEAIKQTIYCILNSERYDYVIYSWNYGIEFKELVGRPLSYVKSELKRRIKEALTQDERILSVDAFSFECVKKKVMVSFVVHTKLGNIETSKEVNV